jgi:hypothetical protein
MTGKNDSSDNALLYTLGIGSLGSVVGFALLGGVGFPIGMIVAGVGASLALLR